jgi:hypothetical protein
VIALESTAASLAKTIIQKAAAAYIADRRNAEVSKKELRELLKPWFRRGSPEKRFLDEAASELASFSHEFRDLNDGERAAALFAVHNAFERADLTDRALFRDDLDPAKLARRLRTEQRQAKTDARLGEAGGAFYDAALAESCKLYVRAVEQVPTFVGRSSAEILSRLSGLPDQVAARIVNAWREAQAVPGVISPPEPAAKEKPARGCPVAQWNPVKLGVHQVIGGGSMPMYIRRQHDELLWAVLDPAVPASRLVVVRGASSTGKTRAAYEAVAGRLADWQLDYPLNVAALKERLDTGIPARTVLWLGELRQYADAEGGAEVLGRLADLLTGEGYLLITTVWPEHWVAYTAAARAGPGAADPAGTVGRLLDGLPELTGRDLARLEPARGGVIDVPPEFAETDLQAVGRTGDRVLAAAAEVAASAGQAGQLAQYLAGVPDLLRRYCERGGDPYGQAVITAAMDAVRLGHASPLPAALVQEAAVGYLTGPQRTASIESWRSTALAWATAELRGAVQALQPIWPAAGTGVVGYQVADYLDQHGRHTREDQLGPASLWDALTAHAINASDLTRLAWAAFGRGLYRRATALWTAAAALGDTDAGRLLIAYLRWWNPGDTTRAAQWAVTHARLDNTPAVAWLLRELRAAGADDAVRALLARDPAGHARLAPLDYLNGPVQLLRELRAAGADDAVHNLATRAATDTPLDNPHTTAELLRQLRTVGADDAVHTLAARAAADAPLDDPRAAAELLGALCAVGADDAVHTLAARAAADAPLDDLWFGRWKAAELLDALRAAGAEDARLDDMWAARWAVAGLLGALCAAGADDALHTLATRAAADTPLDDPHATAELLRQLRAVGADDAVHALLARDPAADARLDDPRATAELLGELHAAGADDAVHTLATRAAADSPLDDPWAAVAGLLGALCAAGADDALHTLATRAAADTPLDDPRATAELLGELRAAGADDAVHTLVTRAATDTPLDNLWVAAQLLGVLRAAGADDAVHALLAREPAGHAPLDNPGATAELLRELRAAGADDAVHALLARDPAAQISFRNLVPDDFKALQEALLEAGADDAAHVLAARAANAGLFQVFFHQADPDETVTYRFGRELDGTPSQPWNWQEPRPVIAEIAT